MMLIEMLNYMQFLYKKFTKIHKHCMENLTNLRARIVRYILIANIQSPYYYFGQSDVVSFCKAKKFFGWTNSAAVTDSTTELPGDEAGFEKNWLTDG